MDLVSHRVMSAAGRAQSTQHTLDGGGYEHDMRIRGGIGSLWVVVWLAGFSCGNDFTPICTCFLGRGIRLPLCSSVYALYSHNESCKITQWGHKGDDMILQTLMSLI